MWIKSLGMNWVLFIINLPRPIKPIGLKIWPVGLSMKILPRKIQLQEPFIKLLRQDSVTVHIKELLMSR